MTPTIGVNKSHRREFIMTHDIERIIGTINDAKSELGDRLDDRGDRWTKGGDITKTAKAVNEFVAVLLDNFAYTFSEDSEGQLTYAEALTEIKSQYNQWI
tara:strand:+ start:207 stop:506 length:300 start_codon:yes stop_codon:yes gene_type:complete